MDLIALAATLCRLAGRPVISNQQANEESFARRLAVVDAAHKELRNYLRRTMPKIRDGSTDEAEAVTVIADLLNRCLAALRIPPVNRDFIKTVLPPEAFESDEALERAVERFKILAMYHFGSFKIGFDYFRTDHHDSLRLMDAWERFFGWRGPTEEETERRIDDRIRKFRQRSKLSVDKIEGHQLWTLGYLAKKHLDSVNKARNRLKEILADALDKGIKNGSELDAFTSKETSSHRGLDFLVGRSAIATNVHRPLTGLPFPDVLSAAIAECREISARDIEALQAKGRKNTDTYLSTEELDVYVATSMRELSDFSTQSRLVRSLFEEGELQPLNVRYFDPTQAFAHDRIDKGLFECLLLMRSKIVLYNAQERDTFGKDSEVAIGLAQGHKAVVFVDRLFADDESLSKLYSFLDSYAAKQKDELIEQMAVHYSNHVDDSRKMELFRFPVVGDIIEWLIRKELPRHLERMQDLIIRQELIEHGYNPSQALEADGGQATYSQWLQGFAINTIARLEARAYTFTHGHPLSLQASLFDGVARGVIVTRTVPQTRAVLKGLLLGTLEYEAVDDEHSKCVVLRDKVTRSAVRVVTKDDLLTSSFWTTFARFVRGRKHDLEKELEYLAY